MTHSNTKGKSFLISFLSGFISLGGFIVFFIVLCRLKMLSPLYLGLIGAFGMVAAIVTFLLTMNVKKHKVLFVVGILWLVISTAGYITGGVFLYRTQDALQTVTDTDTEAVHISIYVKQEDPAQSLEDAKKYTFGILKTLDRDNTDAAVDAINAENGFSIATREYDGLPQLADGLLKGEVGAIILNDGYLSLYEELEGYTGFPDKVRVLSTQQIEYSTNLQTADNAISDDTINLYISGSDTRESTLPIRSRSDVNIIASVNLRTHKVLLLSTPRDYYVPLSVSNGVRDKLTHAGIYGVQTSIDTLEMLYGIDIDYYFRINFTGFEKIVDALGGIEVQSDYEFESRGCHFNKGINYLNGKEALVYCRERYSFSGGDRQRGKNQMEVIKAIANKAASPAILTNYLTILKGVQDYMETSIPYDLIAQVVQEQLTSNPKWEISTYSVDGTGDSQIPYSMSVYAYVMVPDMETVAHAKGLLEQIERGT